GLGDLDNDGLTLAQEMTQGTYDFFVDSDGDGVGSGLAGDSDYVESIWNLDRDYLFCDTSGSPPYTCAYPNPTKKDLYLEIDWMKNGAIEYKPTTTQINLVVSMFANHDITLHVDMGDFGEGEA